MNQERRFTFDQVADAYDKYRPTYPDAMFDELTARAGVTPHSKILEIGSGTAKATLALARRGLRVIGLEPCPNMARIARKHLEAYDLIEIASSTFEDWPGDREAFDLIMAAQSFHWIEPHLRFEKTADLLRPGGVLAVISNAHDLDRCSLRVELDRAYLEHAPALVNKRTRTDDVLMQAFDDSPRFGTVALQKYPWIRRCSAEEYAQLCGTHSDHRLLAAPQRARLLGALRAQIEAAGGFIDIHYVTKLFLASRR